MESDETNMPPFIGLASPRPIGLGDPQALAERIAALEAENAELMRIKESADVLYSEAEEYDFDSGLGMGAGQQYWDDLANALFPDDSAEVIVADLERMQAKALERFEEELNRPEFLPCGHHHSLLLKSAETGDPLYCEYCDCISRRNDFEAEVERLRGAYIQIRTHMEFDEESGYACIPIRKWPVIEDAALAAKEKS